MNRFGSNSASLRRLSAGITRRLKRGEPLTLEQFLEALDSGADARVLVEFEALFTTYED